MIVRELPSEDKKPVIEDVVYMHIDAIDDCLDPFKMTDNFAMMLISIAQSLIIELFYDDIIERSIAICAVRYSLLVNMKDASIPACLDSEAPQTQFKTFCCCIETVV